MTPNRTRAEQIVDKIFVDLPNTSHVDVENWIEQALDEAVRDDRMNRTADDIYKLSHKAGTLKGLEMAITIAAENCECSSGTCLSCELKRDIRAKAKELGG